MIIIINNYSSDDKCNVMMMKRRRRNSKKIATTNSSRQPNTDNGDDDSPNVKGLSSEECTAIKIVQAEIKNEYKFITARKKEGQGWGRGGETLETNVELQFWQPLFEHIPNLCFHT